MKKFFYRVGKGEDVTSVAEKFSIPVTVVVSDNMLKGEISEGDILVLRGKIENIYTVSPRDNAVTIYSATGKDVKTLAEENGLDHLFPFATIIY